VLICELVFQYLLTWPGVAEDAGFLNKTFMTAPLEANMHITALCLGVGSLIVAAIAKATPEEMLKLIPEHREDS